MPKALQICCHLPLSGCVWTYIAAAQHQHYRGEERRGYTQVFFSVTRKDKGYTDDLNVLSLDNK